jgi:hypothetical protein
MQSAPSRFSRVRSQRRHRHQPSPRRNLYGGRKGSQSGQCRQRHEQLENRGEIVFSARGLTTSGLILPSLSDVPTCYAVETGLQETASLALTLVQHDVLPAAVYKEGQRLLEFLRKAFEVRFRELHLASGQLSITLRLADEGRNQLDGLYFTVNLEPVYLNMNPVVRKLDAVDRRLAPALIEAVYLACANLVPVFEGQCSLETVEWLVWGGEEEELLWRAKEELAEAHNVSADGITDEDAAAFAQSHYLTSHHINERLEHRFQQPKRIALKKLRRTFLKHGFNGLVELCDVVEQLETLELPESDPNVFIDNGDFYPFGLVLGLPVKNAPDFVAEMFDELQQHVWNAGGWAPSYLREVRLDSHDSLEQFARSLEAVLQGLALITRLVNLLEKECDDTP